MRSQGGQERAGHEDAAGTMAVLGWRDKGGRQGGGSALLPHPFIFRLFLGGLGGLGVRDGCGGHRQIGKPGNREIAGASRF